MSARSISLITVPYDSGRRAQRMGAGPLALIDAGVIGRLEGEGNRVRHVPIELPDVFFNEIWSARCLQELVATAVRDAVAQGERPIVLSGNCNSSIGTVTGLGADVGVVWLDAHPDLETPETTVSGFYDGQALATLTGRCWRQIVGTIPGFRPVSDEHVLMIGGRDASEAERRLLTPGPIAWLREETLRSNGGDVENALDELGARVGRVYLHVDLDVHGAEWIRANGYASAGGLSPDDVLRFIMSVSERFDVAAASITAFDPAADPTRGALAAATRLLDALAQLGDG